MTFRNSKIWMLVPLSLLATACDLYESVPLFERVEKTPIELTVGGVDSPEPALTRAVVTDGTGKTMQNFDMNTKIFMIMKSEYSALSSPYDDLNFGGSQTAKYTVSRGDVTANDNKVVFDATNQKYWDDAHARSTKLSIWAYAQKGMGWTECSFAVNDASSNPPYKKEAFQTSNNIGWRTTEIYPMIFNWKASHLEGSDLNKQNETTVKCQDLIFSNNLADNTTYSKPDGRLAFDPSTRKFPTEGNAHMIFYHAMSKITIKIVEGDGFDTSSTTDFQFPSGKNVKLSGFNTEGLFSIQQGIFQQINDHADIPSIYLKTTSTSTAPYYTLEALALPNIDEFMQSWPTSQHDDYSRFVSGKKNLATDVMMEFTIDGNKYQITSGQLYDALHVDGNPANALVANATKKNNNGTYIPLEAGKNYVFTFTVGKQNINNITAQVAEWENVTAENVNATNARIKLLLEERGEAQTSNVAFYKKEDNNTGSIDDNYAAYNWKSGYTNMPATYSDDHWATDLYWQSSKDFYHFRALMPDETAVTTDAAGDYASLASGSTYTDVRWGAPMKDDGDNETDGTFTWTYDPVNKGFDNDGHTQIYKAIGPTENPVKLVLFHMMSDLTFNISTTTGTDKVELCHPNGDGTYNRTRLDLVGFYNGGKVLLGTGLVKTDGSASTTASPVNIPFNTATDNTQYVPQIYTFGAVPQDLTAVKLYITTPDNNQYIVDLKDVKATTISTNNIVNPYTQGSDSKYRIDRWYPGFKYVYSFTLKKTGITNLQATVVNWETVTAEDETVQIK